MEYVKLTLLSGQQKYKRPSTKERTDCILEPLEAMCQLSCLAYSQIGTKLTIQNNILYLQYPSYIQGIVRWFQKDTKEDIYFMFHIFRRFIQNYQHLNDISYNNTNLYSLILQLSIKGLQNLIQTYQNHNFTIIHTLQMYENMLLHPELFKTSTSKEYDTMDTIFKTISSIYTDNDYYTLLHLLYNYNETKSQTIIDSIQSILKTKEKQIKEWIHTHCTL